MNMGGRVIVLPSGTTLTDDNSKSCGISISFVDDAVVNVELGDDGVDAVRPPLFGTLAPSISS